MKAKFKCTDKAKAPAIDTCVGTVAERRAIDTSTVGNHTFTVTGTDKAGNVTTVQHALPRPLHLERVLRADHEHGDARS